MCLALAYGGADICPCTLRHVLCMEHRAAIWAIVALHSLLLGSKSEHCQELARHAACGLHYVF